MTDITRAEVEAARARVAPLYLKTVGEERTVRIMDSWLALLDKLEAAEAKVVRAEDNVASLGFRFGQLKCENARLARHYEELRQSTDGGSTSMTHADACHVVEALEQQLAEVKAENTRLRAWMESQRRGVIGFAGEWLPSGPTLWEEYAAPNAAPVVTVLPRTITAGSDSLVTERDFTPEPTVVEGRE